MLFSFISELIPSPGCRGRVAGSRPASGRVGGGKPKGCGRTPPGRERTGRTAGSARDGLPSADSPDSLGEARQAPAHRSCAASGAALFQGYLRLHSLRGAASQLGARTPQPKPFEGPAQPALGGTLAGPASSLCPAPSAVIGALRGASRSSLKLIRQLGKVGGEQITEGGPPLPTPVLWKSHGASLRACHHSACKAFLKVPLSLPRAGPFGDFANLARGGWHGPGPSYLLSCLVLLLPSDLLE